jgi:hypothetical protein
MHTPSAGQSPTRGEWRSMCCTKQGDFYQCWYKQIDLVRISKHPLTEVGELVREYRPEH